MLMENFIGTKSKTVNILFLPVFETKSISLDGWYFILC